MIAHPPDDVEIGHSGFYHHAVGALGNIHGNLAQRLIAVGWVHLVALLVAFQEAARTHRIAKWAIKGAGIFGGIAHDLNIVMAAHFQCAADRADAPVHHVAGCDNIGPGLGLVDRLIDQHCNRFVIHHIADIIHQPILPIRRIGIERDIGEQANRIAMRSLDRADGPAH